MSTEFSAFLVVNSMFFLTLGLEVSTTLSGLMNSCPLFPVFDSGSTVSFVLYMAAQDSVWLMHPLKQVV